MVIDLTYEKVQRVFAKKQYKFFTGVYDLNIFGIRSNTRDHSKDAFDDLICVAYVNGKNEPVLKTYKGTTDPGLKELLDPSFYAAKVDGTAILFPNQYPQVYKFGTHGTGNYKHSALQQVGPITVYRDSDRNTILNLEGSKKTTGFYGINLHAASLWEDLTSIGRYSAGCQVVRSAKDHKELMDLCIKQIQQGLGDRFTYTLLNENDFNNA